MIFFSGLLLIMCTFSVKHVLLYFCSVKHFELHFKGAVQNLTLLLLLLPREFIIHMAEGMKQSLKLEVLEGIDIGIDLWQFLEGKGWTIRWAGWEGP